MASGLPETGTRTPDDRATLGRAVDALRPSLVVHGHYHLNSSLIRPLPPQTEAAPESTLVECLHMDGSALRFNVKTAREIVVGDG